jgi:hypothetical protein
MILIDQKPLESDALNDKLHKLHRFAVEYDNTLKHLKETYTNGFIRFKRTDLPKYTKGADSNFKELPKVSEPVQPWRIPLSSYAVLGELGKHRIMCCLDTPTVLANGLWDMGTKKSMNVKESILVNINEEPDLAFFLYKVSPFVRRGLIKVVDPKQDDANLGEAEREITETKYAVWSMLGDVDKLKTMARAYGVAGVEGKQPNAIRKELEELLVRNDKAKKQNPAIKGTKEFVEEMRVTDSLLLRNFVQKSIDEKRLEYRQDGRWRIGEKIIVQVPVSELERKNEYLCNFLMAGNNFEKLQEFIKDLISKEYLDAIPENKDGKKEWEWLAKIAEFNPQFKKISEIKDNTTRFFCPTL